MQQVTSQAIYEELCRVIPGGVNSPVRAFKGLGIAPMVAVRGSGDEIWDADGTSYIDYCGSWGALIHGHAHPSLVAAACEQIALGSTFGITTATELALATAVVDAVPSVEMVRFVSSGTEATMSAVRLARAYTGRELIIKYTGHYHGHADPFLVQAGSGLFGNTATSSSAGIPRSFLEHTACLPYNDLETSRQFIRSHASTLAAVILEPIAGNMGVVAADKEFLAMLREETSKVKALLIYDEVMTGFRVAYSGAQSLYGIYPDLTCLGKVIGGGFPAAAFGGSRDIMALLAPQGPVYQAGTLSGNPVAMAAGMASLQLLAQDGVYEELQQRTDIITVPVRNYIEKRGLPIALQQSGSMFTLFFGKSSVRHMDDAKELDGSSFSAFFRHLFSHGIYAPPSQYEAWFVSRAHTDDHLAYTRDAILSFLSNYY